MSDHPALVKIRSTRFVTLCGRIFQNTDPQYFPRAIYRGHTIYFCTESCLGAFLADPKRFYVAHRKSAHKVQSPAK
jgi:YHS domain-containing protein